MPPSEPHLRMVSISKRYPVNNLPANDSVNFDVMVGEVHALVGENGAGKTTLMKLLDGIERPDSGRIELRGREVEISSPRKAMDLGIGLVHQHLRLIPEFTVCENIILGRETTRGGFFLDTGRTARRVAELMRAYGFGVDPCAYVKNLSASEMQQVEIVKTLYRAADLLALDEPTAILTEDQSNRLFEILRHMAGQGKSIIFISHKPAEVLAVADRVSVMRKGRIVSTVDTADVDASELAQLMVGGRRIQPVRRKRRKPGQTVYEVSGLTLEARGRSEPVLAGISLSVRSGEILAITGISGNGLLELEDTVSGLLSEHTRVTGGRISLLGKDVTHLGSEGLRKRSFAYVPSNRLYRGASLESSTEENMMLHMPSELTSFGFLRRKRIAAYSRGLARRFSISADVRLPIGTLSGGNIQKAILARELARQRAFVFFSEPTWGIDLAGSSYIYGEILEMRAHGAAILLISTDLDEVLTLADSIGVMHRGRLVASMHNSGSLSKGDLGRYMFGVTQEARAQGDGDEA